MTSRFPAVAVYHTALLNYVLSNEESELAHAYELGRLGLSGGCGLLHILDVHDQALDLILDATPHDEEIRTRVHSAAKFLFEALSPFGMATDGYRDLVKTR